MLLSWSALTAAVLLFFCCFWTTGLAELTFSGPKCGDKLCNTDQYCSEFDNQCKPCSGICDSENHNFDSTLCIKECQGYIHDVRYVRKFGSSSDSVDEQSLRDEISKLEKSMSAVISVLAVLVIILLVWLFVKLYRCQQKKKITFTSIKNKLFPRSKTGVGAAAVTTTTEKTVSGVMVTTASGKPDLRLDMPSNHSDGPPTTMTTITRHPAEDSALDYAYDNPALSTGGGTPSPESRQNRVSY